MAGLSFEVELVEEGAERHALALAARARFIAGPVDNVPRCGPICALTHHAMNALAARTLAVLLLLLAALPLSAADAATVAPTSWRSASVGQAILLVVVFALVGVATAIVGYKIFDKATPGDLTREILENKNIAAAIVAASVIIGVCLIVAAAMIG